MSDSKRQKQASSAMSRWPYTTKGISRGKSLEKVYADNVSIASEVDRKGTMPDWKQEMLRKPSVSIRKGIAWGEGAPFEDTDTLVLTASRGAFVDIRLPKIVRTADDAKAHPSFWAFTGRVDTYFFNTQNEEHTIEMPHMAHCNFIHEIDSHGDASADDEGDMFDLINGECLETGAMLNSATGRIESYKEYWAGVEKLVKDKDQDDTDVCMVARVIAPKSAQGMIIRIGGRIQGVIATQTADGNKSFDFERLIRGPFHHGVEFERLGTPNDIWYRDERSSCSLPVRWLCKHDPWLNFELHPNDPPSRVGEQLLHNDLTWEITHHDDPPGFEH